MQGSYRTVRIVEIRNLFLGRLRHCVWAVEEENRDLLVRLLANIHCPTNAGTRLFPLDLSGRNLNSQALTALAVFNRQQITSQYYGDTVKRIAMPRHGFAGCKAQPTHHLGSVLKEEFVGHTRFWDAVLVCFHKFDFNDTCFAGHRNNDAR